MNNSAHEIVEILLVEDNPTDAELCIRALKKNNLANNLVWVKDGAEALDFLFANGVYSERNVAIPCRVARSLHSTVTLLARLRGWSISQPRSRAT